MIRSKIVRNVAKCLICGETIESTHRYDYRICSCGNLRVDGGTDYIPDMGDVPVFNILYESISVSVKGNSE